LSEPEFAELRNWQNFSCVSFIAISPRFPGVSAEQLQAKTGKTMRGYTATGIVSFAYVGQSGIAAATLSFISERYEKRKNHG
jgi:chromate transport protein ChrA